MQIGYAKWTLNNTLILGILGSIISVFHLYDYFVHGEKAWYDIIFMFYGPLYLVLYLYQKGQKYVTFDDERIMHYNLWPKLIWLADLKEVKFVAADYHFISKTGKTIVVNKESLDQSMVKEFDLKFFELQQRLTQQAVQKDTVTA